MVQHETGYGLFAYPRGRPGRDSQIREKIPCPVDVDQKLCKLRLDYGISESKKMMVFLLNFSIIKWPLKLIFLFS